MKKLTTIFLVILCLLYNQCLSKTIQLVFPQWQGGQSDNIANLVPELEREDAKTGYYLGSYLIEFLFPKYEYAARVEVPVSLDTTDIKTEKGIYARAPLLKQHKKAIELIKENQPSRIVTLGGECSVSVAPFSYLINKYRDDVVVIWIDAHPDITLPGDEYTGYHAMALSHILGFGDQEFLNELPGRLPTSKVLLVGLRSWDPEPKLRQKEWRIKGLSPADIRKDINSVITWIRSTGASKVIVHLDLDVLDPSELIAAVGRDPDGLSVKEVVSIINTIAEEFDLVGLTIAEHMPVMAIKMRNLLKQLPDLTK